jgi:hypothetical protein
MTRILFLDIDGVFIPMRAYFMAHQTSGIVRTFDPCVVGMVNAICKDTGAKLVIHSSWVRTGFHGLTYDHEYPVMLHMLDQGIKYEYFHEISQCKYTYTGTRWDAIADWLLNADRRGEVIEDYFILEDEDQPGGFKNHIHTDFDEGFTVSDYFTILEAWLPPIDQTVYHHLVFNSADAATRAVYREQGLLDDRDEITPLGYNTIDVYRRKRDGSC